MISNYEKEPRKSYNLGDILTGEEAYYAYFERLIPDGTVILHVKDGEVLAYRPLAKFDENLKQLLMQSKEYFVVARDMRLGRRNLAP